MPRVYLAGPITGTSYDECTGWRDKVSAALFGAGIKCYSPMRAKGYLRTRAAMPDADTDVNPMSSQQGILTRDRYDVANCDLLLVNLLGADRVSIGTMCELGWADAYRKPVVLVMESEGNVHDHGFVRGIAGFRVTTLDEAVNLISAFLLPDSYPC
jgi:nucleoside 2-deoxyribosyltransferase